MKVHPYLSFSGNCAEAVALYEKAFQVQAVVYPNEESGNLIDHAEFTVGDDAIFMHDMTWEPVQIGNHMLITIKFDADDNAEAAAAKAAFAVLKEGGNLIEALEENDWNKCFGLLVDKFGVKWNFCGGIKM